MALLGYYRSFVKDYGCICKPLTELVKKDQFGWTENVEAAFRRLKEVMTTPPVLGLLDYSQDFVIETDASSMGIKAMLMQGGHHIAYISKVLSLKYQGLLVYEKELLPIEHVIIKWHYYLHGRHFVIKIDHHSLKYLL